MNTGSWKPFAWCIACCLALILMLPPSSWARPGVDGRNVTTVFTPNAKFRLLTSRNWVEEGSSGATFYFVEENRDAGSVYLFDASRGVRLHLDLYQRQVYYSDSTSPKRALYPISDDSAEIKGWNVSWVSIKEGPIRMTGPKQWVSTTTSGNTYNFVEENRDEWSVYLFEPARGMRLQLDLYQKQVYYSDATTPKTPFYVVTGFSATGVAPAAIPPISSPPVAAYPVPVPTYSSPPSNTGYTGNPGPYSAPESPGYGANPPPNPNAGYYGNPPSPAPMYPANQGTVPAVCSPNTCGSVEAITLQQVAAEGSGLGAVIGGVAGAALGHQVGRGTGRNVATIAGAVAGAIAGHQIEKSRTATRYEITVRMDDGSLRMFSFDAAPSYRVGDRVIDSGGRLQYN